MRQLLLAVLLAGSAQAGIISGGGPTDALSAATAAGTYVKKAGDTMTGRLTAPDATLTYGLTAATGVFTTKADIGLPVRTFFPGSLLAVGLGAITSVGGSFQAAENGGTGKLLSLSHNGTDAFFQTTTQGTGGSGMKFNVYNGSAFTDAMYIAQGGSVGIGTASPCSTCTLHVAGGASVTGAFAVASATFTVATTGIVSAPSQPGVRATEAGATTIPDGAVTPLYFGTDDYDRQNMHDVAASSGNFTVPTGGAGLYYLDASATFAVNATGGRQIYIYVDGVERLTASYPVSSSGFSTIIHATGVLNLTAGQLVTVRAYQNSGGALGVNPMTFTMVKVW